ncbi:MAG: TRAP transporter small permease [Gammaproteobacteria bacterium]|nr:TRAP transporter small permease [Gammaproteobacteria bacterium]
MKKNKTPLDIIYSGAGVLAAVSLVAIMVLVLAQILFRQFDSHIPSSDDMIGFCVVWASFLGLAYTMRHQHHIRVELILGRLSKKPRRWLNILVGIAATVMLAILTYYVIGLIYESWEFADRTAGEVSMPLWLMQLPMGIGCILFCLSMVEFVVEQIKHADEEHIDIIEEQ